MVTHRIDVRFDDAREARRKQMDREIDVTIEGSFPASDPPPWTLGATHWPLLMPAPGPSRQPRHGGSVAAE